jgi:hypothetical protein
MKKILAVAFLAVVLVLAYSAGVSAVKPAVKPQAKVTIPDQAREVTPGLYHLGTAIHDGKQVEGYAIVDYRKNHAKPSGCNNDGTCQGWEDSSCADCTGGSNGGDASSCYGFLAKGAKWKTIEDYLVKPTNTSGLSESFVDNNLATDIDKWETAAGVDILGFGISTSSGLEADLVSPDGDNEVYFADIDSPGAIGVTVVWGVFRGPPSGRQLVEWDQVYDQVDYDWSMTGEPGKMDFENIATHELGHSVGLDDLYDDKCGEQTMYGYADYGETKKRTLESGDITGVSELYQ